MVYCNIDKLLKINKKTKYWLVNQLDSDYQTINKIINNETTSISFNMLEKLCKAFQCTPNDIFEIKY